MFRMSIYFDQTSTITADFLQNSRQECVKQVLLSINKELAMTPFVQYQAIILFIMTDKRKSTKCIYSSDFILKLL